MIRLIIAAIYAFLSVVLLYPYHIYLWILSKKDQYKSWYKSWKLVKGFFEGLLHIAGTKIEVRGAENLIRFLRSREYCLLEITVVILTS